MAKNHYQKLFEHSADAFLVIDGDKFVDCNSATLEMLQYESKENLLATHPSEISPEFQPDGNPSFEKANEMIAIALEKGSNRFYWMHTRKNGESFPVEVLLTSIPDDDKTLIHVVWRDMSERDRLQIELVQAQRIAKIGSWNLDLKKHKLQWSDETYRIFGVDPKLFEVTYESYLEAVHPDDRGYADRDYRKSLKINAQPYRSTHRILIPDGHIKYICVTGETLFNLADEAIFSRGTTQDVTERVAAEKTLQANEAWFKAVTQQSTEGITVADPEGNYTFVNSAFCTMMGYSEQELLQMTVFDVKAPDQDHSSFEKSKTSKHGQSIQVLLQRKDGTEFIAEVIGKIININGVDNVLGTIRDITERKNTEELLNYQATYDALTGLVNRYEFERCAVRLLSSKTSSRNEHALCFMDLDQFKVINDSCGHTAGDELLRQLGKVLRAAVRKRDTLARLGGDEFAVLMADCPLDEARNVANDLLKTVQDFQFIWEGQSFRLGISIGLVGTNKNTPTFTELLKQADAACYVAKDLGRNRIHTYLPEDAELAQRHGEIQWVSRINHALEDSRFCLYAQPIVPLDSCKKQHYELLIRMVGEKDEIIPPGAFLPAAERYGLMEKLDAWVVTNAFKTLSANPVFIGQTEFIAINLSGQSLVNIDFLELITSQLEKSAIEPNKICFEVTETVAISNFSAAVKFITKLKEIGCRFSLDDFGSGLSSFGYLKNLPVDYLKIDGMFVKDIVNDPLDYAMVRSINDIGQVMGMQTIAEFVEDDNIKSRLGEIGVDYAQGFGIGKPKPFLALLDSFPQNKEQDISKIL